MTSKEKNPYIVLTEEQEMHIMEKLADILVSEGLISPGEKARLLIHIRKGAKS